MTPLNAIGLLAILAAWVIIAKVWIEVFRGR